MDISKETVSNKNIPLVDCDNSLEVLFIKYFDYTQQILSSNFLSKYIYICDHRYNNYIDIIFFDNKFKKKSKELVFENDMFSSSEIISKDDLFKFGVSLFQEKICRHISKEDCMMI